MILHARAVVAILAPIAAATATVMYRRRAIARGLDGHPGVLDIQPSEPGPTRRTLANVVMLLTMPICAASWLALIALADGIGFREIKGEIALRGGRLLWGLPAISFALCTGNVLAEVHFRRKNPATFPFPGESDYRRHGLAEPTWRLAPGLAGASLFLSRGRFGAIGPALQRPHRKSDLGAGNRNWILRRPSLEYRARPGWNDRNPGEPSRESGCITRRQRCRKVRDPGVECALVGHRVWSGLPN